MPRPETKFQEQFVKFLHEFDCIATHRANGAGSAKRTHNHWTDTRDEDEKICYNELDWTIRIPRGIIVTVEVKTDEGALTDGQDNTVRWLLKNGHAFTFIVTPKTFPQFKEQFRRIYEGKGSFSK